MNIFTNLYNEGRTIILVTHEPDIATFASRNIVLRDGYIVEDKQNPNMAGLQTVQAPTESVAVSLATAQKAVKSVIPKTVTEKVNTEQTNEGGTSHV